MIAYTRRLHSGIGVERAVSPGVAAGQIWVVRCADFVPETTSPTSVVMSNASRLHLYRVQLNVAPAGQHAQWTGSQVLMAGEQLEVSADFTISFCVTGYVFNA